MMEEDVVLTGDVLAVDGNSKKRNSNSTTSKLLHLNRSINGQNGGVSFFLPPYCKIVELVWSNGVKKDKRGRKMTIFDSRPWYMNYEFVVRTSDNVELNLSMSFFWSLENIAYMIRNTDDAPGDICHHARSEIIQAVSKVTLKDFMENFNQNVNSNVGSNQLDVANGHLTLSYEFAIRTPAGALACARKNPTFFTRAIYGILLYMST